jgi:hypothetical protein
LYAWIAASAGIWCIVSCIAGVFLGRLIPRDRASTTPPVIPARECNAAVIPMLFKQQQHDSGPGDRRLTAY